MTQSATVCTYYRSTYFSSIVIDTGLCLFILFAANWVSNRWQWSVDLYKNREDTAQAAKQYTEQIQKHRIHKIDKGNVIPLQALCGPEGG